MARILGTPIFIFADSHFHCCRFQPAPTSCWGQPGPQTLGPGKEGKRISARQSLEVIDALAGDAGALVPFVAAAAGALSGAPG